MFTKEEIEMANQKSIVEIAKKLGMKLKEEGNEFKGTEGLTINETKNTWYNFKTNKGGGSIQFIMEYEGLNWKDSVSRLIGKSNTEYKNINTVKIENIQKAKENLILPEKADNYKRLFAFLIKTRGISAEVVASFVKEKKIYQDKRGNVVFVGRNEKDEIKFASVKGTVGKFQRDVLNSNKKYAFSKINKNSNKLFIFESPIDLMSYISLEGDNKANYISLGGIGLSPLKEFLANNKNIKEIQVCTDNDKTGEECYKKIKTEYCEIAIAKDSLKEKTEEEIEEKLKEWDVYLRKVYRLKPKNKDFNEDLIEKKEEEEVEEMAM